MNDDDWLQQLKPGDTVLVKGTGSYAQRYRRIVEKVTATQIVVNGVRYCRKRGWERGGGSYDKRHLVKPTPVNLEEILRKELHERIKAFCNSKRAAEISLADLQAAVQLLDG